MRALRSNTTELTDDELIRFVAQGKEQAYHELFERYWERLFSISLRITKDEEIAKDVVQEVMLSIWTRRETLKVDRAEAYLSRSAKLQSLKMLRDSHQERFETLFEMDIPESPGQQIELNELQDAVSKSIEELPERCREVFLLSRNEQLTNAQIAEKLNISQRTVETHISNALSHLKDKLLIACWVFITGIQ
ncbi:MAG: RNA polymerase sigma-70 factor [Flavobacteriales bacterium]